MVTNLFFGIQFHFDLRQSRGPSRGPSTAAKTARAATDDARLPRLSTLQTRGVAAEDHAVLEQGGPRGGQRLLHSGPRGWGDTPMIPMAGGLMYVDVMDPKIKWMITGGTLIVGNLHMT